MCIYVWLVCTRAARKENLTLTLTHMITAYSVSGNVVHIYIHICVFLYGFFPLINGMYKFQDGTVANAYKQTASRLKPVVKTDYILSRTQCHTGVIC